MDVEILGFLKRCRLQADDATQLEGQLIPRSMLISQAVYDSVQPDVLELKKKFSSSALTSLQSISPVVGPREAEVAIVESGKANIASVQLPNEAREALERL